MEDPRTNCRQRSYCRVLGTIIVAVGLVALSGGLSVLVLVDVEDLESRSAPILAVSVGTFGFFLVMVGPYYISKSVHMDRHRFYPDGIAISVRSRHVGWMVEVRGWDEMGRFYRWCHWYMGPAIIIDMGIPGDSLIVPESMQGFDLVEELLSQHLEEANGPWELFD